MYIRKIEETEAECFDLPDEGFVFGENKVQGARLGKNGNALKAEGATRFKLYTESADFIKILRGNGHFKWKRGETDFSEGDCFEANGVGEYEINGASEFLAIRK